MSAPVLAFDVVPPTVGVDVRSLTMFYEPDGGIPVAKGGLFLAAFDIHDQYTGEATVNYRVVGTHHGRPRWHTIPQPDVDWSLYTGLVRKDVVQSTITAVMRDAERHKADRDNHIGTMVRLQAVIS